jgi:hypothetical protein
MRYMKILALSSVAAATLGTAARAESPTTWAYAAKTGVGASYEAYVDGAYKDGGPTGPVSKVWFSIADGTLTETMYGLIHEAQIKQMRVAVRTAAGLAVEGADTTARTEYLHVDAAGRPLSPAYKVTTTDRRGRFEIEKRIFTDPDRNALFVRVTIRALKGPVTPFLVLEPHMANTGGGDAGSAGPAALTANEAKAFLSLKGARPFVAATVSDLVDNDALAPVKDGGLAGQASTGARRGAIVLTAQLPDQVSGRSDVRLRHRLRPRSASADQAASATLATGYAEVLARYNGEGDRVGWEDYLASLTRAAAPARGLRGRRQAGPGQRPDAEGAGGPHLCRGPDRLAVQSRGATRSTPQALDRLQGRLAARLLPMRHGPGGAGRQADAAGRLPLPAAPSRSRRPRRAIAASAAGSCRSPGWTARPNGSASSSTRPPCRSCWAGSCGSWAG